jgi:small neutral amino acid transporter SnatA (MarC family)
MNDHWQSSALTPIPSPAMAGEGSIVTEMVVNHFRKT